MYSHTCSGVKVGSKCTVACDKGYSLTGSAQTRQCQVDLSFSGTLPTCTPNLCTQPLPTGSDIVAASNCTDLRTAQQCQVSCANGYSGAAATYTCASSGYILGTLPTCTAKTCPAPTLPTGGDGTCSNLAFGQSCLVSCGTGYTLKNNTVAQTLTCRWDTATAAVKLTGTPVQCTANVCTNGIPSSTDFTHNCTGLTASLGT